MLIKSLSFHSPSLSHWCLSNNNDNGEHHHKFINLNVKQTNGRNERALPLPDDNNNQTRRRQCKMTLALGCPASRICLRSLHPSAKCNQRKQNWTHNMRTELTRTTHLLDLKQFPLVVALLSLLTIRHKLQTCSLGWQTGAHRSSSPGCVSLRHVNYLGRDDIARTEWTPHHRPGTRSSAQLTGEHQTPSCLPVRDINLHKLNQHMSTEMSCTI